MYGIRYLTLRYLWLFFSKQSKLFLLHICNCRLLCALYIVIDFYALQGFFDLKLLFQGTCGFSRELRPRIPHHYDFCISKNGVPLIGHGYATAYIFHKKAFKLTTSRDCLMVWIKHFLRKPFANNINKCNCNNN